MSRKERKREGLGISVTGLLLCWEACSLMEEWTILRFANYVPKGDMMRIDFVVDIKDYLNLRS